VGYIPKGSIEMPVLLQENSLKELGGAIRANFWSFLHCQRRLLKTEKRVDRVSLVFWENDDNSEIQKRKAMVFERRRSWLCMSPTANIPRPDQTFLIP
jgi:hypothetical protein